MFAAGFVELWKETDAHAQKQNQLLIAQDERENALALAEQYKTQYQAAVFEIADLKAENERFKAALDELRAEEGAWRSTEEFRIMHYCPCADCTGKNPSDRGYGITATGTVATAGRTVSVDPSVITLGSEILINGQIYVAEDTGVTEKCIDIFVDDHAEALRLGTYLTAVSWR